MLKNQKLLASAGTLALAIVSLPANAGPVGAPFSFWSADGWTAMTLANPNEDGTLGPGVGGQPFDAEYLYFKQSGNTLSLGIQAGFDLVDGHLNTSPSPFDYYSGDLAVSFDGNTSTYEYGVDFGLLTRDYQLDPVDMGSGTGIDPAGFYAVSSWNTDVYSGHTSANPFAIDAGSLVSSLSDNSAGSGSVGGEQSYWRTVSFDIGSLGLSGDSDLDVHWTMSCGNDVINGSATITSVPEPSILALLASSLLGIGWVGRRRKQLARA